ncbi:MAG: hypothetical protein ACFFDB_00385 [Promethearchaeota archaeon]
MEYLFQDLILNFKERGSYLITILIKRSTLEDEINKEVNRLIEIFKESERELEKIQIQSQPVPFQRFNYNINYNHK